MRSKTGLSLQPSLSAVVATVAVLALSATIAAADSRQMSRDAPMATAPVPMVAGVPPGTVGVPSWWSWIDTYGQLNIVADVFNNASTRMWAYLRADLYDASDVLLGTWYVPDSFIWGIAAGNHAPAVFSPQVSPAGFDHVVVSVDSSGSRSGAPAGVLLITPNAPVVQGDGEHFTGTITNKSTVTALSPYVFVTLYTGTIVNSGDAYSTIPDLAPGASAPFEIVLPDHYAGATRFVYQAQAVPSGVVGPLATPPWTIVSWDNYFDDIGTSSFRSDIIWLASAGITGGCAAGLYCPSADVTRGQMAAFLARALNLPATSTDYFTDDEGSIFENDINRLAAAGITGGCTATTFCPNATVTRGQMAAFLDRALSLPATSYDFFTDDEGSIFEGNINRLAAAGITGGCTPTTFCPADNVTRGQMAAFLHRALK